MVHTLNWFAGCYSHLNLPTSHSVLKGAGQAFLRKHFIVKNLEQNRHGNYLCTSGRAIAQREIWRKIVRSLSISQSVRYLPSFEIAGPVTNSKGISSGKPRTISMSASMPSYLQSFNTWKCLYIFELLQLFICKICIYKVNFQEVLKDWAVFLPDILGPSA